MCSKDEENRDVRMNHQRNCVEIGWGGHACLPELWAMPHSHPAKQIAFCWMGKTPSLYVILTSRIGCLRDENNARKVPWYELETKWQIIDSEIRMWASSDVCMKRNIHTIWLAFAGFLRSIAANSTHLSLLLCRRRLSEKCVGCPSRDRRRRAAATR